jgi:ribonucleoside-diphosphate reductase alpha chain
LELTGQRLRVWQDRYQLKDSEGKPVETSIEQTWRRVAKAIASVENDTPNNRPYWEDKFYSILEDFKFVPGGRILAGAGSGNEVTYFNCFVLPSPLDSREGIFDNLKLMSEIMARGGGVGVNLSTLRPRGSYIKTVNGHASGPVSWAELYSVATGDVICQGGSRRGALMLMLDVSHPDIEEFITAKREQGKLQYCNLSVAVSDEFMYAVKEDWEWNLLWGDEVKKTVKARDLWRLIAQSAWESGEPGVVFLERYNKESNTGYFSEIVGVNPCGEVGLEAYGVCNLGSINLSKFVYEEGDYIKWNELWETVQTAVRFLDNVIDATPHFLEQNAEVQKRSRRIGIGTLGLADMLIKLKIRYGSQESLDIINDVYSFIRDAAYEASIDLARERGAFPAFDADKFAERPFIQRLAYADIEAIREHGIRNATLLAQAPTGTISLLAGCSSGIEPNFSFVTKRKDRLGTHFMIHPLYEEWQNTAEPYTDEIPDYFVTAQELSVEEHIKVQAAIQQYTDSSISKTINAPNSATVEEVEEAYMLAYDLGCKGVTYFRDGSREGVLSDATKEQKEVPVIATTVAPVVQDQASESLAPAEKQTSLIDRPFEPWPGLTYKVRVPLEDGNLSHVYVTVTGSRDVSTPLEVFINSGVANRADHDIIARLVSHSLRSGVPLDEVIDNLWKVKGYVPVFGQGMRPITCIANALGYCLQQWRTSAKGTLSEIAKSEEPTSLGESNPKPLPAKAYKPEQDEARHEQVLGVPCPECKDGWLVRSGGCQVCDVCGFSPRCGD